jgi:hypothetical protein
MFKPTSCIQKAACMHHPASLLASGLPACINQPAYIKPACLHQACLPASVQLACIKPACLHQACLAACMPCTSRRLQAFLAACLHVTSRVYQLM